MASISAFVIFEKRVLMLFEPSFLTWHNSVGNSVWTSVVLFIVILDGSGGRGSGGPLVVKWWKHIWGSRHIVLSPCYHSLSFGIIYLKVFISRVYKYKITKKKTYLGPEIWCILSPAAATVNIAILGSCWMCQGGLETTGVRPDMA